MKLSSRPGPALEQRQSDRTILIVDDEEVLRDLCARALDNYRTLQAADGREALETLGREPVDLVLTDVMMPGMNGLDLLQEIKQQNPNRAVVMMTGYGDKEVILRSLKLNADDFISKPINLLQLRTTIGKVLEKISLREELIELQKMDQLKSDFLGLISHKLKTPVTVISLFIQNLAREFENHPDAAVHRNLALIQEESNYLASLIQDLLQYSGKVLNPRPPHRTLVDFADLVPAILVELREQSTLHGLEMICDLPNDLPAVRVDQEQIRFCLRALLDNALKFTPEGGRVTLTAAAGAEYIELSVTDTGPGIAPDQQQKIFKKFYQIDPDNTGQVRGFGLGLYYAREFLRAHGGRLDVRSLPGRGATFSLSLPLAPEKEDR
ncbi:hybrid sensor histidine kinase/response regulator [Geothermobacter hydrogeniphilus]|uniref:histidine kinase n=1 Tax=Geothermobacter hydrogeniphilus TaxID=1969733 RepID=A0A2K2H6X1_9BACT|nr:response regulator [Geothermobacter hydrogeniphilus]PNU18997.1 hybrid sensor histidine kinase/response regulator [Geothermobacter hydrogeniphilus]